MNLYPLINDTRGACETLLCLLQQLSVTQLSLPTITLDGDTFYETDILGLFRQFKGQHCIFYHNTLETAPLFSYVTLVDKRVTSIREKVLISSHACTGAYGFGNGLQLLEYAQRLMDNLHDTEYYMSMIYDLMLNDNITIYAEHVDKFHCVGTPAQLKHFANGFASDTIIEKSQRIMRICFDLDNTLVTSPCVPGDYSTVKPLQENIDMCREMKRKGHTIIIYTARRMRTHNGNLGRVVADIAHVTLENLKNFEIPFDEIYFGKPFADVYIDDKAINPIYGIDKEFGLYPNMSHDYDRSQFAIMPCRVFNRIESNESQITKYSTFENLKGEFYWYNHIDSIVHPYIPKIIASHLSDTDVCYIVTERIKGPTFSQLYVNGALTPSYLFKLLSILEIIHKSPFDENFPINILDNYTRKVKERFDRNRTSYHDLSNVEEIKNKLLQKLGKYEQSNIASCAVIHGDPVFTNVVAGSSIKLIDMRGKVGDVCSLRGDIFYDFAKVYQSLIGYDFILMEKTPAINYSKNMTQCFMEYIRKTFPAIEPHIHTLTASLFFTLIPLHSDESWKKRNFYLEICNTLLDRCAANQ